MISVCMATYNGEKYIKEQLGSILKQIGNDDEIVISDDASTDNTCAVIESIDDVRIRLLHNDSHNFKWNFANALKNAKGDIIFLSDQDDVWIDGKYDQCVSLLKTYDLVITDSVLTDENLQTLKPSFFDFYHSGPGILKNSINNTYYGACMAFNRRVLNYALPFPFTKEIGHDIWIGLVAEMVGKVIFLHKPYLLYRRHQQALTNLSQGILNRSKRSFFVKVWSRFVVLFHVLKFYVSYTFSRKNM